MISLVINLLSIILASILFSSQFAKYKISNWKPLNCEICLAFWFSIAYFYINKYDYLLFIYAGAISQLTKIANVMLIKLYGRVIGK